MSKLWRALVISTIATGTAAVVLKLLEPPKPLASSPPTASKKPYVDADTLSPEHQDALLQELASQV